MIEGIEISPTDRAKCNFCGKVISKGTPRGIESVTTRSYTSQRFYCYKCVLLNIEEIINFQKEIKKRMNKLIKKQTKEIIMMELENDNNK